MNTGHWLVGWLLVLLMIGFGVFREWWWLAGAGVVLGVIWWFIPDWLNHEDPPEDIR